MGQMICLEMMMMMMMRRRLQQRKQRKKKRNQLSVNRKLFLMSNLGMMKQTWWNWKDLSEQSLWKDLFGDQANKYQSVTESTNFESHVSLLMIWFLLMILTTKLLALKIMYSPWTSLLSTRSKYYDGINGVLI